MKIRCLPWILSTFLILCFAACHAEAGDGICTAVLSVIGEPGKSYSYSINSAVEYEYQILTSGIQPSESGWASLTENEIVINGLRAGKYDFYVRGKAGSKVCYYGHETAILKGGSTSYVKVRIDLCDDVYEHGKLVINGHCSVDDAQVVIEVGNKQSTVGCSMGKFSCSYDLSCGNYTVTVSCYKNGVYIGGEKIAAYVPACSTVSYTVRVECNYVSSFQNLDGKVREYTKGEEVVFAYDDSDKEGGPYVWTVNGIEQDTNGAFFLFKAENLSPDTEIACACKGKKKSCTVKIFKYQNVGFNDLSMGRKKGFACGGYLYKGTTEEVIFPGSFKVYKDGPVTYEDLGFEPIEIPVTSVSDMQKTQNLEIWLEDFSGSNIFGLTKLSESPVTLVSHGDVNNQARFGFFMNLETAYLKETTRLGMYAFVTDLNLRKVFVSEDVNFIGQMPFLGCNGPIDLYFDLTNGSQIDWTSYYSDGWGCDNVTVHYKPW